MTFSKHSRSAESKESIEQKATQIFWVDNYLKLTIKCRIFGGFHDS